MLRKQSQQVKKTKKKYDLMNFPTFHYLIFGGILLFGPKSSVSKWSWALAATALFTGDRHKFIIGESESFLTSLWQQHHYQNDRQLVFFFVICRWVYLSFTPRTEFNIMTFCNKIKPKVIIQFSFLSSSLLANRNLSSPDSDSSTIIKMNRQLVFFFLIWRCVYLSFSPILFGY